MKYYVKSGDLKMVVDAEDEIQALATAFQDIPKMLKSGEIEFLARNAKVSEKGFEDHFDDDTVFPTNYGLGMAGHYHLYDALLPVVLTDKDESNTDTDEPTKE